LSPFFFDAHKFVHRCIILCKGKKAVPGAVVAIQTFGDFLGFHPHLHILVSDGCFHENGMFTVSPAIDTKALEQLFRHKVLKMLLSKDKITQDMIKLLDKWRHTGFNVYCGSRILPWQKKSMENLARYTCPPMFVAGYSRIFLPGTHDLSSGNRSGGISIKRRKRNKDASCAGVARRYVLPRSQQRRADGSLL